jgi:hypothetical protein
MIRAVGVSLPTVIPVLSNYVSTGQILFGQMLRRHLTKFMQIKKVDFFKTLTVSDAKTFSVMTLSITTLTMIFSITIR